jgi:hypothetical protein
LLRFPKLTPGSADVLKVSTFEEPVHDLFKARGASCRIYGDGSCWR